MIKFTFKTSVLAILVFLVLFLSIFAVSAYENGTDVVSDEVDICENISEGVVPDDVDIRVNVSEEDGVAEPPAEIGKNNHVKNTSIKSNSPSFYYNEKGELVGYLKDDSNVPVGNKNLTISLNGKTYTKTTDGNGKIVLNLNLKPNTYNVNIRFAGDSSFSSSCYDAVVKVIKAPLSIKTNDFTTYVRSDSYFKTKVFNKISKKPVGGIRVLFKVFIGKKLYKKYYATTDKNGIARLNKNLKVGVYRVQVSISDKKQKKFYTYKNSKRKVTMKVKPTSEMGCCSLYVQVSSSESLTGFRRDSTYSVNMKIKSVKWHGRTAVKQYKTIGGYSFHSIITSDGWMIGTGGADGPNVNKAIEKIAGAMVKSGSIQKAKLKNIRRIIASLGFSLGHFAIKAPNGKYAIVWVNGYKTGKLKSGEYLSVPNSKSSFRYGKYVRFDDDPVNSSVKILASDSFGINRRDITVFHWKATTKDGSTTSSVKAYAANDNGKSVGRSTGHLKDNVYFKNKFYSKNKLPTAPSRKYLGVHKFSSINKFKVQTTVDAPAIKASRNVSKIFKVTIKNKSTKKLINGVTIKLKVITGNKSKIYTFKTNNGVVRFNTTKLGVGTHKVVIFSGNVRYYISKSSKIVVKD